jgi:hypothetical protein
MWKDPIVEETRKLREQYASKFNHDIDAIYEDIKKRQAMYDKKLVTLPVRKSFKAYQEEGVLTQQKDRQSADQQGCPD